MSELIDPYKAVLQVVRHVADGYPLTRACIDAGITTTTFKKWLKAKPEFQELYAEAEQTGHDAMADALLEIESHRLGSDDPQMAAIKSKNIQWFLSRRAQTRYGDRMTVDHNITTDAAIIQALDAAKNAFLGRQQPEAPKMIDVTPVVVEDDWMKDFV